MISPQAMTYQTVETNLMLYCRIITTDYFSKEDLDRLIMYATELKKRIESV